MEGSSRPFLEEVSLKYRAIVIVRSGETTLPGWSFVLSSTAKVVAQLEYAVSNGAMQHRRLSFIHHFLVVHK